MDEYQSLSHTRWEVQISRSVHSQVPQKDIVRRVEAASRGRYFANWRCKRRARLRKVI